jgi:hypothetical protein
MGFDINVELRMLMCSETGKPYYFKYDEEKQSIEKVYELPTVVVPEELRPYLMKKGRIFHAYTEVFNDRDTFDVDVETFLESFPSWDEVKEHSSYKKSDDWTLKDHKAFKKLLKWCAKQEPYYHVSWSY